MKQVDEDGDHMDKRCAGEIVFALSFVSSIFCRVLKPKGGRIGARLLRADLLADLSELTLPDSLDLLFADILRFRADTKST